jgi:lysozyme family protein
MGPGTIAAERRADAKAVRARMRHDRLAFMSALPAWRVFGKGWLARIDGLEAWTSKSAQMQMADAGTMRTAASR